MTYKSSHKGNLPKNLEELEFKKTEAVKKRLASHDYKLKEITKPTNSAQLRYGQSNYNGNAQSGNSYNLELPLNELGVSAKPTTTRVQTYQLRAASKTDTTASNKSATPSLLEGIAGASSDAPYEKEAPFTQHKVGEVCFDRR